MARQFLTGSHTYIDHSRYYYSHLVAARGCGSWAGSLNKHVKECEVKCKYCWEIVQNKYENLIMLHIRILCGKDLFSMGIYRLIQTKYISLCVFPCMWNPAIDTTATPYGHQMAVVTWDRSILPDHNDSILYIINIDKLISFDHRKFDRRVSAKNRFH